jgi:hypothetical protein
MAWKLYASNGCDGGTCSSLWRDDETGWIRARGLDPETKQERDVEISPEDWSRIVANIPR